MEVGTGAHRWCHLPTEAWQVAGVSRQLLVAVRKGLAKCSGQSVQTAGSFVRWAVNLMVSLGNLDSFVDTLASCTSRKAWDAYGAILGKLGE